MESPAPSSSRPHTSPRVVCRASLGPPSSMAGGVCKGTAPICNGRALPRGTQCMQNSRAQNLHCSIRLPFLRRTPQPWHTAPRCTVTWCRTSSQVRTGRVLLSARSVATCSLCVSTRAVVAKTALRLGAGGLLASTGALPAPRGSSRAPSLLPASKSSARVLAAALPAARSSTGAGAAHPSSGASHPQHHGRPQRAHIMAVAPRGWSLTQRQHGCGVP